MSSSRELARVAVLRGEATHSARPARLTADLATNAFARTRVTDARLVDPVLEQVVADAAAAAAEAARRDGYDEGHRAGLAAAQRDVDAALHASREREAADTARHQTEVERALSAVHAAAAALDRRESPAVEDIERRALQLAVELAELLIGRELAITETPVLDAVRRALRAAPSGCEIVVRLNPSDVSVVMQLVADGALGDIRLVGDETVEPGGCLLDAASCHIDARLSTALARVKAALQ